MKEYTLIPKNDYAQSFYGKAIVKEYEDKLELYSYDTLVCTLYKKGLYYQFNYKVSEKLLFSNTTLRHIKEFLLQNINILRLSNYIDGKITKKDLIRKEGVKFDV